MGPTPKRAFISRDLGLERLGLLIESPDASSYRDSVLESIFITELVQSCAMTGRRPVEIARNVVGFEGYNLIATCGPVTRQIKLEQSKPGLDLDKSLEDRPSGCCVVTIPFVDAERRRIAFQYRWFGGDPGERLIFPADAKPARLAVNRRREPELASAEPPNYLRVGAKHFARADDIDEVADYLFGPVA
jgi:hypothetical protein